MAAPVLVIDFGSQVTQLIARRVRESGVYCEIVPYNKADEALKQSPPQAIILSGGPASVTEAHTPRAPQAAFELGVPVLGICYGEQTMVAQLGGRVEGSNTREFGRADIEVVGQSQAVRRRLGAGCGGPCLDEPWRSRHRAADRLPCHRHQPRGAIRRDR